jgi:hypothetical protein
VQKEKDRYPLFPEILKHKSAEERLAEIADQREQWWQRMRDYRPNNGDAPVKLYVTCRLVRGAAIKRYWQICGFPGDPDYLIFTSTKRGKSVTGTSWPSSDGSGSGSRNRATLLTPKFR